MTEPIAGAPPPAEWTPTAKQLDLLEAAQEPGLKRSITSVCRKAQVSRESYYSWIRDDPSFRAAWHQVWRGSIDRAMPGVMAAMLHKALAGDVQAARLVADVAGIVRQRLEHTGAEGGPLEFTIVRRIVHGSTDADA